MIHAARRVGFVSIVAALVSWAGLLLLAQLPQDVGAWASIGARPESRVGAAAVTLPDGRTVIAGGLADNVPTGAVVIFDPADGSFTNAGQLMTPRVGHTAVLLNSGRILIAGGMVNGLPTPDIELFDLESGTSVHDATMTQSRSGHAAAGLSDGTVLIVGGSGPDGVLRSAEIFDPVTRTPSLAPLPLTVPRTGASATTLIDGRVLIAGGSNGIQDLASAEIYNPFSQSFEPTDTSLSVPRSSHSAVLLPYNNSVLIAGGSSNGVPQTAVDLFVPAEFPDPYSYGMGWFASTGSLTAARSGASGVPDVEGYAFVTGGGATDAEVYRFAAIKTDKDDYAPGERAIITGSGWQPNEKVTLRFQEDPAVHDDYALTVTADGAGNIYWDRWAPEEHDLNVRFYLMARDSRSRAQITFTDSNGFDVTPATQSVVASSTNTFVWMFTATNAGNQQTTTFTVPAGWTSPRTGAGPGQVKVTAGTCAASLQGVVGMIITIDQGPGSATCGNNSTFTLTYSNATAPASPPQSYTFINQHGSDPIVTVTGPANAATTTSITAPTIVYGANGSVTVGVSPNSGVQTPTGNVNLSVDGGIAVTRALVGGAYTFTHADVPELASPSAGSHSLSASYAGDTGFAASGPALETLTVLKADATVLVAGTTVTYDGQPHGATGSATGINGEDLSAGLALGASFLNAPGGTADWTFTGGTNYHDASGAVAIVIEKADATVLVAGTTVTYDGQPHGATGSATGINGEDLSAGLALGASFLNAPGGTADWTFTGGTNYHDASGAVAIVIKKAPLGITASSHTITFNDPVPAIAPIYAGFVSGEDANDLDVAPTCTTGYTVGSLIGTYPSSCIDAVSGNYAFSYTPGVVKTLTACSTFNGFLMPIGGSVETTGGGSYAYPVRSFKLNSTIPVKFSATCFNAPLTTGVHTLQAIKYSNSTTSGDPIDATPTDAATIGNQFRLTGYEWHFNLTTKPFGSAAQGIWLLKATLFDGSTYTVWIEVKK